MIRKTLIAMMAATSMAAFAQVRIEVPEPGVAVQAGGSQSQPAVTTYSTQQATTAVNRNATGDLYNQILQLQQEIMNLRGVVEEQGEQLRQLKQQRMDDYISLDRRVSQMAAGGAASVTAPVGSVTAPEVSVGGSTSSAQPSVNPAVEEAEYKAAYELVKNRDFAGANNAFNEFLTKYPSGSLAGNAHYWLAELYLLEGDSTNAKRHFEALVNDFGGNSKVPDGMFKLGRIYHQQGEADRAKATLQRVIDEYSESGSSAPRLASEYMRQNF